MPSSKKPHSHPPSAKPCVAVFAKHASSRHSSWQAVVELLQTHGYPVLVCDSVFMGNQGKPLHTNTTEPIQFASIATIEQKANVAVIIGGDGTFLGIARQLAHCNIPLVGINQGRLGFLTDIRLDEIDPILLQTLAGQSTQESRLCLQSQLLRKGEVLKDCLAINDVVISRGIVGGMVELRVEVDGQAMYDLRADGLIVSTPTGSTAYALSADGPILHPNLSGLLMVPVAPHALTNRPIALPQTSTIVITVIGGKQSGVHFDMQVNETLKIGDQVRVVAAPHRIQLLHPAHYDYFAMLRDKLHWSASPTDNHQRHQGHHGHRGRRDPSHAD